MVPAGCAEVSGVAKETFCGCWAAAAAARAARFPVSWLMLAITTGDCAGDCVVPVCVLEIEMILRFEVFGTAAAGKAVAGVAPVVVGAKTALFAAAPTAEAI